MSYRNCHRREARRQAESEDCHRGRSDDPAYGEFLQTFTFDLNLALPIVQPGANLVFPIVTKSARGVFWSERDNAISVPRGIYRILVVVNPGTGGQLSLLVNGTSPTAKSGYAYFTQVSVGEVMYLDFLVEAPRHRNLISLVNSGTTLFTLGNIPNSQVGNTSLLTHVQLERVHSRT